MPIMGEELPANSPPVADAGGPYIGYEGSMVIFNASKSYDPDGDPLEFWWNVDGDIWWDTRGPVINPEANHTWPDDYFGEVIVNVSDGHMPEYKYFDLDITTVTIYNVDPVIGYFDAPVDPVEVNTIVQVTAGFYDQGINDTHNATIDWGDGTITDATIDEINGSGTLTGSYAYFDPGVYTLTLTVIDDDDGVDVMIFRYIVVYADYYFDCGFVTGGGWINSPEGAYTPDTTLTGKANFGFVSKYKKGQSTPSGNTEFQFKVANLNFHSANYYWLVVAGAKAIYKGVGTINGEGSYGFMLSAIDEELTPSTDVDLFRIKIWDKDDNDKIVYDNNIENVDYDDPNSEIAGGQIVIHKK
jgi:hypothetical protein